MSETTRRAVLAGMAGASTAVVLAGCGSDGAPAATTPVQAPAAAGQPPVAVTELAKTTDIPVNGGKIFAAENVVVTQPMAGEFKAFSATCTHKGCLLAQVTADTIMCKCHGTRYNAADGSVLHGPATVPLPVKQITVEGDTISLV